MNQNGDIIGASAGRWIVCALLVYLGVINGFTALVFVAVNGLLTEYFVIEASKVDWLYLGNACGSICFGFLMGTLAKHRSVTLKSWFLEALLLDVICFTSVVAAFLQTKLLPLMFIGQFLNGFSVVTTMALTPITASAWFREKEQATVYGLGNAAVLVGNGAAAIIPSIFIGPLMSAEDKMHKLQVAMVVIFAVLCISTVAISMLAWKFLPDLPRFPPTFAEARRRQIVDSTPKRGFCAFFGDFLHELKYLACRRVSLFLVLGYSISLSVLILQFMFLPPIVTRPNASTGIENVTTLDVAAAKAYMLSCMSVGGMLGSIIFGRALDKLKSYKVLAGVLGFTTPLFSVAMFLTAWFQEVAIQYVAIFLFGLCLGPIMSFCGEMLKQYVYPNATEITQGLMCNCLSYVLQLPLAALCRFVINGYGGIWFYLINCLLCVSIPFMLLTINPSLNRFQYQNLPS